MLPVFARHQQCGLANTKQGALAFIRVYSWALVLNLFPMLCWGDCSIWGYETQCKKSQTPHGAALCLSAVSA